MEVSIYTVGFMATCRITPGFRGAALAASSVGRRPERPVTDYQGVIDNFASETIMEP